MIPEIGSVFTVLGIRSCRFAVFLPAMGVARNDARLMASSRPLAWLLFSV